MVVCFWDVFNRQEIKQETKVSVCSKLLKLLLDGRSNAVQMQVNPHEGGGSSAKLRPQQGKITPIAAPT